MGRADGGGATSRAAEAAAGALLLPFATRADDPWADLSAGAPAARGAGAAEAVGPGLAALVVAGVSGTGLAVPAALEVMEAGLATLVAVAVAGALAAPAAAGAVGADLVLPVAAADRGLSAGIAGLDTAGDWPCAAAARAADGAGLSAARAVTVRGVVARPLPLGGGVCSVTAAYPL